MKRIVVFLGTHRFQVKQHIFCVRFWMRPVNPLASQSAETSIRRAGGMTYLRYDELVFFGFPKVNSDGALTRAARVQRDCARQYPDADDVSVSVSSVASTKWKRVIAAPWDFVGTAELAEALTAGVQFTAPEYLPKFHYTAVRRPRVGIRATTGLKTVTGRPLLKGHAMATVSHRKMKPGETIFGGGSGILMPFAPASSDKSKLPSSPSPMKKMSEEQIQAELKKLKDEGYGPMEIDFAEAAMKGLEGKPEGNA